MEKRENSFEQMQAGQRSGVGWRQNFDLGQRVETDHTLIRPAQRDPTVGQGAQMLRWSEELVCLRDDPIGATVGGHFHAPLQFDNANFVLLWTLGGGLRSGWASPNQNAAKDRSQQE